MIKFGMLGLSLYNTYIVILDIYSYFRGLSFNYADPTEGFYMWKPDKREGPEAAESSIMMTVRKNY